MNKYKTRSSSIDQRSEIKMDKSLTIMKAENSFIILQSWRIHKLDSGDDAEKLIAEKILIIIQ